MSKNIKTASGFGGVGGGYQPSPFSPGNAPFGLSGKSRGGSGVNIYESEDPFNKILEKVRQDEDQSELSIESHLLKFHKNDVEQENLPYLLDDPIARLKAKHRKQLHDYTLSLQEEAKSIEENSVDFINKNTKKNPVHYRTIEQSLEASKKHKYKPNQIFDFENELPVPKAPERIHYSNTNNLRISDTIGSRGKITKEHPEDLENRNPIDDKRLKQYQEGNYPLLSGDDGFPGLNKYLDTANQANQDHRGSSGYNERTINDGINPDTNANVYPSSEISKTPLLIDENISLEANLNRNQIPYTLQDHNNASFKEQKSNLEKEYNTFGIGIHGNSF